MRQYYKVLTIAGSDSGGGAGIQADIKTISALGCYAASAISAVTVQNTTVVKDVLPLPASCVGDQIEAVLDDIGADAVKIGMLSTSEQMKTVAQLLRRHEVKNVVVDPVMVSTSGHLLMEYDAQKTLREQLLPLARVMTPNIPEAETLLHGAPIRTPEAMCEAAEELAQQYGVSVWLKGGHLSGNDLADIFYNAEEHTTMQLESRRVTTLNTHGTGCTLSSALASCLAKGMSLSAAVKEAKEYINQTIIAGADYVIGHGHGPVHHFYQLWK